MKIIALQSPPADVARAEHGAMLAFVGVGVAIALAPALPLWLRPSAMILALVVWAAAIALLAATAARAASRSASRAALMMLLIGAVGTAAAVLAAVELPLVRWLGHRPALTWFFDWRWALGHARAIARFGGVDRALDYAGAPINYHVGPAWLAGAVERALGASAGELVLFGLVPLLCALSLLQSCTALLAAHAVPRRTALAAS